MPKMQVYLPDELYDQVKKQASRLNVSGVLQEALVQRLAELERRDALAAAVASYEDEFGSFTEEELKRQAEEDKRAVTRPKSNKKAISAA
ncbi:MAG: hypothetical protein ABI658_32625 [Acidimicrobiales bacterium]